MVITNMKFFEYLKMDKIPWNLAAKRTLLMSDNYGHLHHGLEVEHVMIMMQFLC